MVARQEVDGITWIDLESPSTEEIEGVQKAFSIDPFVAEELKKPSRKPYVTVCSDYIYLVLHFPAEKHSHSARHNQEVNFIVGKKFLITVRYDVVDPIHKFKKTLETESIVDALPPLKHAGELFYRIVMKLYGGIFHEIDYQRDALEDIEDNMFKGREKEMVREISKASSTLRNFSLIVDTHSPILDSLARNTERLFGKEYEVYVKTLVAEHGRTQTTLRAYLDTVIELRETNNSLLTTKQNEIMKVLTIMAFVTFPLALVAGIFGMNTKHMPIIGHPHDFWLILGLMSALTIIFFLYFLYRRWL